MTTPNTTPMRFKTKKAALEAVEECQHQGWAAGIIGSGPWQIQATGWADSRTVRITYDLHKDGFMREYSRKEVA